MAIARSHVSGERALVQGLVETELWYSKMWGGIGLLLAILTIAVWAVFGKRFGSVLPWALAAWLAIYIGWLMMLV
jgi:hypothetical protein